MTKVITETRMLRYNFTPEEHLANTAEASRLYENLGELESNHKAIKQSLKEQEEQTSAELSRLMRLVRDKCDHRKTECRWIMDCPALGQKTLRRNDTDVDVEVRRMEDYEKQDSLNLQPVTEELPLEGVKAYPDPPADFHGSLEEWHAHCDKPAETAGPQLVEGPKPAKINLPRGKKD